MYLAYLDIILFIILLGFVYNGLNKGFIKLLGRIVALIIGIILTSHLYIPIYQFLNLEEAIAKVLVFIFTYILLNSLINWLFVLIEGVYKLLSIIPFTKLINKLMGAVLGLAEGLLLLSVIIHLCISFNLLSSQIEESIISPIFLWFIKTILVILPTSLQFIQNVYGAN